VTPHSFTPDAEQWARTMPIIQLVDGALLIRSMNRSMKGVTLPATYKAMCCQCGEIVRHQIDKPEVVHCGNGHKVAPTIARASLIMPRKAAARPSD
jgi:hypothetical protein